MLLYFYNITEKYFIFNIRFTFWSLYLITLCRNFNDSHLWYLIFLCLLYIFLNSLFVRMSWRSIWKMHSVTENCPVSATGLEFLPKSLCLCACIVCVCVCVCVCVHAHVRAHACTHVLDTNIVWIWILTDIIML